MKTDIILFLTLVAAAALWGSFAHRLLRMTFLDQIESKSASGGSVADTVYIWTTMALCFCAFLLLCSIMLRTAPLLWGGGRYGT